MRRTYSNWFRQRDRGTSFISLSLLYPNSTSSAFPQFFKYRTVSMTDFPHSSNSSCVRHIQLQPVSCTLSPHNAIYRQQLKVSSLGQVCTRWLECLCFAQKKSSLLSRKFCSLYTQFLRVIECKYYQNCCFRWRIFKLRSNIHKYRQIGG